MTKTRCAAAFLLLLFSLAAPANAQSDAITLQGNWISESVDGVFTQLEVESSGRFVFRQIHAGNLGRDYMCGNLADRGDELVLKVGAKKERSASGVISEMVGQTTLKLEVVRRTASQLVLNYKSDTVIFQLT